MKLYRQNDGVKSGRQAANIQTCVCSDEQGLFLNNRQVSWAVAVIVLLSFFVFITGYFLGKRKAVEAFSHTVDQHSFADQIYTSMCSLYDAPTSDNSVKEEPSQKEALITLAAQETALEKPEPETTTKQSAQVPSKQYMAQLIGFGTQKAAEQFKNRLCKNDMPVKIIKRQSKTAKGKVTTWYQAVTHKYDDKHKLETIVDQIAKKERLKGTRIVVC